MAFQAVNPYRISPDIAPSHVPSEDEQAEYDRRLQEATVREEAIPPELINGRSVSWRPQNGSQNDFLQCRLFECLYHGTRGPGKTDGLIWSYAQFVGRGFGAAWRGIIFRQTYPQLADVQAKTEKWFKLVFGDKARFNRSKMQWEWDTGEVLLLRHMARPADYWNYHGHEYPFIGWEELTNWSSDECFKAMMACSRSTEPNMPRMVRATTNPYGVGHNWVQARYRLTGKWWRTITVTDAVDENGRPEPDRCAIHGHIDENKILLAGDPDYKQKIVAAANNPAMMQAWLEGSWDITAGGMFDDVWSAKYNIVPVFRIPLSWRLDRSFDWGSSAPFSVGWWAESDGTDVTFDNGVVKSTVRGDLFRVREWYGWNGHPNQGLGMLAVDIAKGIVEREIMWGWRHGANDEETVLVKPGPADNSIHNAENGNNIGLDMVKPVRIGESMHRGVSWARSDKSSGSRATGWESMRRLIRNAHPIVDPPRPREDSGLFVTEACEQFIRTVPSLPRKENNMDDVDSASEDHVGDETRYRVRFIGQRVGSGSHVGMY